MTQLHHSIDDVFFVKEVTQAAFHQIEAFVYGVYESHFPDWDTNSKQEAQRVDAATAARSRIFAAFTKSGEILATCRLTERLNAFLPVEHDFSIDVFSECAKRNFEPNRIFEVGRLARCDIVSSREGITVQDQLRAVDAILYRIVQASAPQEINNVWFASADDKVLPYVQSKGYPFEPLGLSQLYLGSGTTPVILPIDTWKDAFRRRSADDYAKFFAEFV